MSTRDAYPEWMRSLGPPQCSKANQDSGTLGNDCAKERRAWEEAGVTVSPQRSVGGISANTGLVISRTFCSSGPPAHGSGHPCGEPESLGLVQPGRIEVHPSSAMLSAAEAFALLPRNFEFHGSVCLLAR